MTINSDLLSKKALGILQSIEKMSVAERKQNPTAAFGEDYNKLHDLVSSNKPDLLPLMPPKAEICETMYSDFFSKQNYAEIHSFCSQIYQLLS
jgi:hypothetical protein